jgi:predicted RNA-binding Zn-ribbon protein involved in translation (DUF1610 family)
METMTRKTPAIEKHLVPKAQIVRCPEPDCGSSNIRIEKSTERGVLARCQDCQTCFYRRNDL